MLTGCCGAGGVHLGAFVIDNKIIAQWHDPAFMLGESTMLETDHGIRCNGCTV
jgi:hypothetical protein